MKAMFSSEENRPRIKELTLIYNMFQKNTGGKSQLWEESDPVGVRLTGEAARI